jgi:murein L,D-transpeptidase YafK
MLNGFLCCVDLLFLQISYRPIESLKIIKYSWMKNLCALAIFTSFCIILSAQKNGTTIASSYTSFIDYQKTFERPAEAISHKEDTLRKQFEAKKLTWPAKYIYLRSFKFDSQLEVWVKNEVNEQFKFFKSYKVCALAGTLGPKRMEGDFQVPEGFYYVNEFNAKSNYYLSLGLNYPNASDRVLSDSLAPGGDIYIHGSCVTIGCIPLTDSQIDEIYIIAMHAKNAGQDFIPVHIFPIKYNVPRSVEYMKNATKDDPQLRQFEIRLSDAFDYFEKYRQLPVVMVNEKGDYVIDGINRKASEGESKQEKKVKIKPVRLTRSIPTPAPAVTQAAAFPGGVAAYDNYLKDLGKEMVAFLPLGVKKAYVKVEFIIDTDGKAVNFKMVKGVDEEFDDELITRLEKMPNWQPAMVQKQTVARKIIQSIDIVAQ